MNKNTKIVIIGCGAVGITFLYSAISENIAKRYEIIDINQDNLIGNKLDLDDTLSPLNHNFKIEIGSYNKLRDADILIITAGRAQKPNETRLNMISDNSKIMKNIAILVKRSGFSGITLIASNPVDIMTFVYQQVTNFNPKRVISSSCILDTNRLKFELSEIFNTSPSEFSAFILGEHGDSSIATFEYATLNGIPLKNLYKEYKLDEKKLDEIHSRVVKKAGTIINKKGATFYGIASALTEVVKAILNDEKKIFAVGSLLNGEYGEKGVYAGIPSLIGKDGIIKTFEFPLSLKERDKFKKSISILKENTEIAKQVIRSN